MEAVGPHVASASLVWNEAAPRRRHTITTATRIASCNARLACRAFPWLHPRLFDHDDLHSPLPLRTAVNCFLQPSLASPSLRQISPADSSSARREPAPFASSSSRNDVKPPLQWASAAFSQRERETNVQRTSALGRGASVVAPAAAVVGAAAAAAAAVASVAPELWMEWRDVVASGSTLVLALLVVRIYDELCARGVTEQKLSRKLVHITMGLLFMICWPLFSASPDARFYAAAVPAANIVRLALLGLGITKNENIVKAVTREGNPRELLRGPIFYVITICTVILCFWRSSPAGALALTMMCGGDGIADIVGRRLGSSKLPWNSNKSWAGSVAMFFFGSALSVIFLYYLCHVGFYDLEWWSVSSCASIALVALGATLVESLPISEQLDDNLTVPLTAALLGMLLLQH